MRTCSIKIFIEIVETVKTNRDIQDLLRFAKICQDLPRFVKICQDLSRFAKICQDLSRFIEISQHYQDFYRDFRHKNLDKLRNLDREKSSNQPTLNQDRKKIETFVTGRWRRDKIETSFLKLSRFSWRSQLTICLCWDRESWSRHDRDNLRPLG